MKKTKRKTPVYKLNPNAHIQAVRLARGFRVDGAGIPKSHRIRPTAFIKEDAPCKNPLYNEVLYAIRQAQLDGCYAINVSVPQMGKRDKNKQLHDYRKWINSALRPHVGGFLQADFGPDIDDPHGIIITWKKHPRMPQQSQEQDVSDKEDTEELMRMLKPGGLDSGGSLHNQEFFFSE